MKKMRLLAVSLLFLMLLNDPLLSIANRAMLVAGIPLLYLYVTVAWLVLIILIAFIVHQNRHTSDTPEADE
ncbi:hypothetical protein GCM10023189_26400 [Nibrella saemangeumensis]|uniref:DUF3311 domain-containing protein n=1 Tax=Nibrella saemangeumensis TaxID=1084526 RepID=A0ABP8MY74_9BACT